MQTYVHSLCETIVEIVNLTLMAVGLWQSNSMSREHMYVFQETGSIRYDRSSVYRWSDWIVMDFLEFVRAPGYKFHWEQLAR